MENNTALVPIQSRFIELFLPSTKEELLKLADMHAKSNLVPACFRGKAADIVIAWSLGMPLGLNMMQCLLGIAVINGRPTLWGDVLNGLVLAQPDLETFEEVFNKENFEWTCTIKRKGRKPITRTFSKEEAEQAKLYPGKLDSAWSKYPKRMTQMRARGFTIRDSYADKTSGLSIEPGDIIDVEVIRTKKNDKPSITDRIAEAANNPAAPEANEDNNITPEATPEPAAPQPEKEPETPEYYDAQKAIELFRKAKEMTTLESLSGLTMKVDPAFIEEVTTERDRAAERIKASEDHPTPDTQSNPINPLVAELRPVVMGFSPDLKKEVAGKLFGDNNKKFQVGKLSNELLEKLKVILTKMGKYHPEED